MIDRNNVKWHKSSHSDGQGGACVEHATDGNIHALRHSKNPEGPILEFTLTEWKAFLGGVKDGEFG